MAVQLNHTILWVRDKGESSRFLAEILGVGPPSSYGPFAVVQVDNEVSLDFHDHDGEIASQHYAFLVSEEEFDAIFGRIQARGLEYWADPGRTQPDRINTNDGGRGVYWAEPSGHFYEIITVPYGGWPADR
jgi:hypothetical protein